MTAEQTSYYAPTAYRSDNIPDQLPSEERSWLKRFGKRRLPWGYTLDIAPDDFLRERSPDKLRFQEQMFKERDEKKAAGSYVPALYEHVDFHDRHDHERFRFSLWSTRSQFWLHLLIFGKGFFLVGLAPLMFALVAAIYTLPNTPIEITIDTFKYVFPWVTGLPLICWALGSLVIHKFPKLWVKPSRGPIWELNRRTGLVTLFDYNNNGEYKKNGTIGELTAPFYEFDAYIVSVAERQGSMNHVLFLAHRYRDIVIDFSALVNLDNRWQMPCALWDFLQNYMDTSGPLPELPRYEEFRHLDPTTAVYDQQTGRPPRFWIDMDDATYKQHLDHLLDNIDAIDTFQRPSLMAQYVRYVD
ncbi:hypothetical protein [Pseudomonas quasicaspiana]|uniref:hypothetical protein n=1 Tax=Pseudomonas quasicaspiana TaxID=2829821 RepID=UPI001E654678|nr:hypothetical protein [Pseudomonas quasicaspiana]MCD5976839.1 hypothetical protein [Pseudomonas quasicaspiana]